MKKISAFFTALILFALSVLIIHCIMAKTMTVKSEDFGAWINNYKDLSSDAMRDNLDRNTVMLMGSSELQRAKNAESSPSQFCRRTGTDMMITGAAYNQCLSHAITLGALSPDLKSKKAVLILSPSWFEKTGVRKPAFSVRFSETAYLNFMNNPAISKETKKQVAERAENLLTVNPAMEKNVKSYNRVFLKGHRLNVLDRGYMVARKMFLREREYVSLNTAWKAAGLHREKTSEKVKPDFNNMRDVCQVSYDQNPFHMREKLYRKNFVPVINKQRNAMKERTFPLTSPEYGDLELFLKVAQQEHIKVKIILLPMNGWWYDHTGFKGDRRNVLPEQIKAITAPYDVDFTSFYDKDYTDGWLQDAFHPSKKGWVDIDEEIYEFYNQQS